MAVMPTTFGLSFLAMAVGSPVVAWTTAEVVVVGRSVDDVVDEVEVVTLLGGFVVVVVSHVSPGPAAVVEVLLACVEDGRREREQPLTAVARARATSPRARTRLRKGTGARFIR
jgi:hypothetical protein